MKIKNFSIRFCLQFRVLWILKALWIVLSETNVKKFEEK